MKIHLSPELKNLLDKPESSQQKLSKLWKKSEDKIKEKQKEVIKTKEKKEFQKVLYSFD